MSAQPAGSQQRLLIAVDDTDSPAEGGTGRVAREIARRLADRYSIWGVTRHQFAVLPGIPYTRKNSGNVIHLLGTTADARELAEEVLGWLEELAAAEAEPGLCVAHGETLIGEPVGRAAQQRVVKPEEAVHAAQRSKVTLTHPRPAGHGIIGAFAAACLAAQGSDGRFVDRGELRALAGQATVAELLAAGIEAVVDLHGDALPADVIRFDRLRPALQGGRCVLYCSPGDDGSWQAIVGAPGDVEKERQIHAATSDS